MPQRILSILALTIPGLTLAQVPTENAAPPWACYVGGGVGYSSGKLELGVFELYTADEKVVLDRGGPTVGGELGCDYSGIELPGLGPVTLGPVIDIQLGSIAGSKKFSGEDFFDRPYSDEISIASSRSISLRGRLGGVPQWNQDLFFYGTMGYAWDYAEISWESNYPAAGGRSKDTEDETSSGWVFGFGAEFQPEWIKRWNGKLAVEYMRTNLEIDDDDDYYDKWEEGRNSFRLLFRRYF